jgi:hypothetical protein
MSFREEKAMKFMILYIVLVMSTVSFAIAQNDVWVNVEKGIALYLNPKTMGWEPIVGKQQVPTKTYAITKEGSVLRVFRETDIFPVPAQGYFFIGDIFLRDKMQVVEELTSIEAQQLPPSVKSDTTGEKQIVGLTYGLPTNQTSFDPPIPYFGERTNAIKWFYEQKRYDAALLSLKRSMTQFPKLYLNYQLADLLCKLYDKLELYGFLYEETNKLSVLRKEGDFGSMIVQWNEIAKKKLTQR